MRELGYEGLLGDRTARRRLIFGFMAENGSGLSAQLAEQLRDGTISSAQALKDTDYARLINNGVENLKNIDPSQIRDQLDELAELDEAEESTDDELTNKVEHWTNKFHDDSVAGEDDRR